MEQVTMGNLDEMLARYAKARGGELNEHTESEASFVFSSRWDGAFILSTKPVIMWIGLQNATARVSNKGAPFDSIRDAARRMLHDDAGIGNLFYSENAVERLRFLADRIEAFKAGSGFRLVLDER